MIKSGKLYYIVDNIQTINKENELLLWIALPKTTKDQIINIQSLEPEPIEIIQDENKLNTVGLWKFQSITDEQLVICCEFQSTEPPIVHDLLDTASIDRFLVSEDWIEITKEIKEKSEEISGKYVTKREKAFAMFEWLIDNMQYEYPDFQNRGAKKSFPLLKGDCGEFSVIYCAMCRSIGIPARTVTCIWDFGSGHQWAEIYLEKDGWINVDPSLAKELKYPGIILDNNKPRGDFLTEIGLSGKKYSYLFGHKAKGNTIVFQGTNNTFVSNRTSVNKKYLFMQPGGLSAFPKAYDVKNLNDNLVQGFLLDFSNLKKSEILQIFKKEFAAHYLNAGKIETGIAGLQAKLIESPNDFNALFYLGSIYFEMKKDNEAKKYLELSLTGDGGSSKPVLIVWAKIQLGNIHDLMKERDTAIEYYNSVIEQNIDFDGSLQEARNYLRNPYVRLSEV